MVPSYEYRLKVNEDDDALAHLSDQLLVLCERKYTQQQLESKSYNIIYLTNQVAFLLFKKLFMQSSKYYDTVFQLKKEFTKSNLVLYLSFILVTWSLLQVSLTDFFENNDNILMKIPSIYAQDNDGRNGNGGDEGDGNGDSDGGDGNGEVSDDNGDSDVEELSQKEEDSQDEDIGQEDSPEELTLSEDGRSAILTLRQQDADDVFEELTLEDSQDEDADVSRFVDGGPYGTDITSQLLPGDPLPLPVALPPLPGGPSPPGALPPIPGSPLPPGSPIPPGGGPTPPEDLLPPPLPEGLPSDDDGHHDDDDDENEEDGEEEEKENEDEDNDDKDNN